MPAKPSKPTRRITLTFRKALVPPGADEPETLEDREKAKFRACLSAVEFADEGKTLFLGGDETVEATPCIERLKQTDPEKYGGKAAPKHESLAADSFFADLPDDTVEKGRRGEIDIEGLNLADGWLWVLGSHSTNRKKLDADDGPKKLARVSRGANRYVLGRIPAVQREGRTELVKEDGARKASRLPADKTSAALLTMIEHDPHLGPLLQLVCKDGDDQPTALPGKDNGFDLEGLAVVGSRLLLGLRGPVLRGWAVILELAVKAEGDLELQAMPDGRFYRKHFVNLQGLGMRDLVHQHGDLLLLAGPTTSLDGPVRIYRWEKMLEATAGDKDTKSDLTKAPRVELSFGDGDDHAEGIALIPNGEAAATEVMVVYDSPARSRLVRETGVRADVFPLPSST